MADLTISVGGTAVQVHLGHAPEAILDAAGLAAVASETAARIAADKAGGAFERVVAPASPPTATASASAGNPNGTYYYRVSYITGTGETEVTAGSEATVTVANKQVDLTNIPVSADPAVTGRRIYRTVAGASEGVLGKLVTTIGNNTATTYTDNTADGSLGAAAPYFNTTGGDIAINGERFLSSSTLSLSLGYDAGRTGYANTFAGSNAGKVNTTGFRNVGVGVDALQHNTTGYENTAVGVHALDGNTTGRQSCAFGYGALQTATTADYNCAFGTQALSTATGGSNTALGTYAGQLTTSGANNVSLGYKAGQGVSTGLGNVAVGYEAGLVLAGGDFNVFIGQQAGKDATDDGNVGIGLTALSALTSGSNNTAVGPNAGKSVTTGVGNVFIGASAGNHGSQKVDAFTSIVIGFGVYCTRDNEVVIGKSTDTHFTILGVEFAKAKLTGLATTGASIADVATAGAAPTQAEFNALVNAFNALLARLRTNTIITT